MGRYWCVATDEQKKRLTGEFRALLVYTYAGAIAQIKDQQLEYKPFRADPSDTDVIVHTQVIQPRGTPIQLSYRLEKKDSGWKIYDVNVLRSEEHTSELQSLMRISYAVFCLKKKRKIMTTNDRLLQCKNTTCENRIKNDETT